MTRIAVLLLALVLASGSTAADRVGSRHIVCFSGGRQIIEDDSDPTVDLFYGRGMTTFVSLRSHRHIAVVADCLVTWTVP